MLKVVIKGREAPNADVRIIWENCLVESPDL